MTYKEAIDWIKANKNLIGTKTENDLLLGDLVAVPTNSNEQEVFLRSYVLNRNGVASIIPYVNSDLEVWAIDTYHLETSGVLFYKKLADWRFRHKWPCHQSLPL